MKVLHLISGGDSGGAKTHVFTLLNSLKNRIDVKIICLTPGVFYEDILNEDIPVALIKQKNRFDLSVLKEIQSLILNEGYQIVHAHGARANFVAMCLKKKFDIPVITTMHSDYLLDFENGIYKKYLFTKLNSLSLKRLDYYAAVSTSFKRMLINRKFNPNDIFTIYNGIVPCVPEITKTPEEYFKDNNIPVGDNNVYVGILARLEKVKGIDVLINGAKIVCEKMPDVHFVIGGNGDREEELKELVNELHIQNNVHFIGLESIPFNLLNACDINVLTSRSESFPYAILEGALLKKPTIASAVGGIPDLISEEETGMLFDSENYNMLAEKIIKMASSAELREYCGNNLNAAVLNNYTGDSMAISHINIYNEILLRYKNKKIKTDAMVMGYYGYDNSGDDALLEVIISDLRRKMPFIRLLVLSNRPEKERSVYFLESVNRFNLLSVYKKLKSTKVLIYGGGSLIQDVTSSKSLFYYLFIILLAKFLKVKVMLYGNGVGPVLKRFDRVLVAKALKKVDAITLREPDSYNELIKLNVNVPILKVTSDPAINLDRLSAKKSELLYKKFALKNDEKYFAVSVRPWKNSCRDAHKKIAAACDYICEKYGLKPVFIPMQPSVDMEVSKNISCFMKNKAIILETDLTASEILCIVEKTEFVLAMRLHMLIYAAAACVPLAGIVYDPKIIGFMNYLGQNSYININDFTEEELIDCLCNIVDNKEVITENITKSYNILSGKAKENTDIAVSLINA